MKSLPPIQLICYSGGPFDLHLGVSATETVYARHGVYVRGCSCHPSLVTLDN